MKMTLTQKLLQPLIYKNKYLIQTSEICQCLYCKKELVLEDIVETCDDGQTAICSRCHVDAVYPHRVASEKFTTEELQVIFKELFDVEH